MRAKCRDCGEEKIRSWSGRFTAQKKKIYTEGVKGRVWNGLQCPACKYQTAGANYMNKDSSEQLGPRIVTNPLTHRKCRKCRKHLPQSKYFKCYACTPDVGGDRTSGSYGSEDWGYGSFYSFREGRAFRISDLPLMGGSL